MSATTGKRSTDISKLLTPLQTTIIRIDRRPATGTIPFHDIYIAELEQEGPEDIQDSIPWAQEAEMAVERVRLAGGNARLIGLW